MTEVAKALKPVCVESLDRVLGQVFPVLNDGFVRPVDYMGGDESIVQAARVSYGEGTKKISDDRGLIRYLMRHRHSTPFEMCEIKFHVRVPMDCWRQWIRHRTANVNEYSTRYSPAIDSTQTTDPDKWRAQSVTNKQGSGGFVSQYPGNLGLSHGSMSAGEYLSDRERESQGVAREVYDERIRFGVAREQARKDLPLSTYTEAYWKIDLHNLFHFLGLRMDSHAQAEIAAYANVIGDIVAEWCPLAWEAFSDYRLSGMFLTRMESEIIRAMNSGQGDVLEIAMGCGWLNKRDDGTLKPNRERSECESKLEMLGMKSPWNE